VADAGPYHAWGTQKLNKAHKKGLAGGGEKEVTEKREKKKREGGN